MNLIRVEYTYSDGTKKYIEGEELEKWNRYNAIVAHFSNIHGCNPSWEEIKWKLKTENNEV